MLPVISEDLSILVLYDSFFLLPPEVLQQHFELSVSFSVHKKVIHAIRHYCYIIVKCKLQQCCLVYNSNKIDYWSLPDYQGQWNRAFHITEKQGEL